MSQTTAGRAIVAALERAGIRHAFTVPGESFLELLDALRDSSIRLVTTRHEAGAGFMAEAYAQLTGRPAVCLATRAVGTANLAIALHTAMQDSAPLVAISGQVPRAFRGREAFQEADLAATFGGLCKAAVELDDPADAAGEVERLALLARAGRPGPVLIAIPEDVLRAPVDAPWPAGREPWGTQPAGREPAEMQPAERDPAAARGADGGGAGAAASRGAAASGGAAASAGPGAGAAAAGETIEPPVPTSDDVAEVLRVLASAERPVVVAGGGVLRSGATAELRAFAEEAGLAVIAAWRRPDVFPGDSPRYLGATGLSAARTVRPRLLEADVILALGTRLSEIASFEYAVPAPATRLIHVDVEPGFRGDRPAPALAVRADARAFLRTALALLVRARSAAGGPGAGAVRPDAPLAARRAADLARERAAYLAAVTLPDPGPRGAGDRAHPATVVAALRRHLPEDAILTTDAGNFAGWAARYLPVPAGGRFLGPTSGAMGYGLPAAIGAGIAARELEGRARPLVALGGDGGLAMLMAELETAVRERLRLTVVVFDNAMYGTIRMHQERAYPTRVAATDLGAIDFAAVAEACGARAFRAADDREVDGAVAAALRLPEVALVHVLTDPRVISVDATLPG